MYFILLEFIFRLTEALIKRLETRYSVSSYDGLASTELSRMSTGIFVAQILRCSSKDSKKIGQRGSNVKFKATLFFRWPKRFEALNRIVPSTS
jgi:hypothetical protein